MKSYRTRIHTLFLLFFCLSLQQANGQLTDGLIAYYSFDDCTANDNSLLGNGGNGTVVGNPTCDCGVSGDAMVFDGIDDYVYFSGNVNAIFQQNNFTLSFYFKPFDAVSTQNILSKRVGCTGTESVFNVEYLLSLNFITTDINESATKKIALSSNLDLTCWHHYLITRENKKVRLYLNGKLIDEKVTSTVLDLSNSALLRIADSPCIGQTSDRFRGVFDELRIYNRILSDQEIQELYLEPDLIENRDPIIYLGEEVQADIPVTCATNFTWTPGATVSNVSIPNPILTPTETTRYSVTVLDKYGCSSADTLLVTVIDPADLDCRSIFLPKAFTPNDDNLNDVYGISNPQALRGGLKAFEIFDRWGERVFATGNAFDTWDGTFKGQPINGNVFVYRITYTCDGQEYNDSGTLTLMK
jgi:gliding motility-associated-like protein